MIGSLFSSGSARSLSLGHSHLSGQPHPNQVLHQRIIFPTKTGFKFLGFRILLFLTCGVLMNYMFFIEHKRFLVLSLENARFMFDVLCLFICWLDVSFYLDCHSLDFIFHMWARICWSYIGLRISYLKKNNSPSMFIVLLVNFLVPARFLLFAFNYLPHTTHVDFLW